VLLSAGNPSLGVNREQGYRVEGCCLYVMAHSELGSRELLLIFVDNGRSSSRVQYYFKGMVHASMHDMGHTSMLM
jgi:hypothetical protein